MPVILRRSAMPLMRRAVRRRLSAHGIIPLEMRGRLALSSDRRG
ncbi:hypothetical protein [Roseomonas populi]|uniref:Uncharacterized protein n=1 Tax=Roseomonas populi TaxID=3121582 RepID=A0ABT1XA00_9PROT|nr:hypothetical protein [Roseomonas pecuniae]MCR0984258.1 hypothetical protein [Roseomonas pecuniae]